MNPALEMLRVSDAVATHKACYRPGEVGPYAEMVIAVGTYDECVEAAAEQNAQDIDFEQHNMTDEDIATITAADRVQVVAL